MTVTIKTKKGIDIPIPGKAKLHTSILPIPDVIEIIPDHYPIYPKLSVKEGDVLNIGSPIFHDKIQPDVFVVSPVCGEVLAINRGERRKILSVSIRVTQTQSYQSLTTLSVSAEPTAIKQSLKQAGLWVYLRERPFDVLPKPEITPKAIFVSLFDSAPLAPDYDYIIKGEEEAFEAGLAVLAKLTSGKLYLGQKADSGILSKVAQKVVLQGPHPVGNPSVMIQQLAPINKGEHVWTVDPQTVLYIGRYALTGKLDFSKKVAVTGPEVINHQYFKTIVGASIEALVKRNVEPTKELRYISGNVLSGKQIEANGFLLANHNQLSVIAEGSQTHELFGWAMPRLNRFSLNKSYFSWLKTPKNALFDARLLGGKRTMIFSGEYDKVFPFDILPEYLIRAMLTSDFEKMELLGIYELVPEDFALCEYVCTSKMPLQKIAQDAISYMRSETE